MKRDCAVSKQLAHCLPADLKPSTLNQYVSILNTLWKKALGRDELELSTWDWDRPDDAVAWHGNWVRIWFWDIRAWLEANHCKETTLRNYWNVIHICLRGDEAMQRMTTFRIKQLNGQIVQSEDEQSFDEKEEQYAMSHDALLDVVEDLWDRVKDTDAYKEERAYTVEELKGGMYEVLFEWLALACYVYTPPLRSEWGSFRIEKMENFRRLHRANYYDPDTGRILINRDKVSDRMGQGDITATARLQRCIEVSLKLYPREYVIVSKGGCDQCHTYLASFLRSIEDPVSHRKMNQGIQLLRSSYITWYYERDPPPNLNDKKRLAYMMRHSWQMAESSYRKIVE